MKKTFSGILFESFGEFFIICSAVLIGLNFFPGNSNQLPMLIMGIIFIIVGVALKEWGNQK